MSDGGPFHPGEYASFSSVLPLIILMSPLSPTLPPPPFFVLQSLPLCCLSHYRTVKFILIPSFWWANCPHYLLLVLNCWINKFILTIYQPGDKLFGSRRLRSHEFSYLRFCNYSPGGCRHGPPLQKWSKIHDHVSNYKYPYILWVTGHIGSLLPWQYSSYRTLAWDYI